jgi:hypothetical protein
MNTQANFFCAGFNAMNALVQVTNKVGNALSTASQALSTQCEAVGENTKCFYYGARTAWHCRKLQVIKLEVRGLRSDAVVER